MHVSNENIPQGKTLQESTVKQVEIFTDGSCLGNPGAGGWAAILRYKGREKELSGGDLLTTNNRMELTAVIQALDCLKERCTVTVYSDSKYVIDAVENGWANKWRANNWMRNKKEKALNSDLWEALLALLQKHRVTFCWVRGHNGHPENERCDELAVSRSKEYEAKGAAK